MKILAVDFGDARTGLAICDKNEMLASPIGVLHERRMEKVALLTVQAAAENGAELIVVGNPLNMNGTAGQRSALCCEFAELLRSKTELQVDMWDERSTTVSATYFLNATDTRGKKRKNVIDTVAATIILESYLAYRKNNRAKGE